MAYRSSRTRSTYDYAVPQDYGMRVLEYRSPYEDFETDDHYLEKMRNILSAHPNIGVPREPTPIQGTVFLGSTADAENIPQLKAFGITYLLNCAGGGPASLRLARSRYTPDTRVVGYEELAIHDSQGSEVKAYFAKAHQFLDFARSRNARVLIYCPGVSRSGAVALSYLLKCGVPLLEACKVLKNRRRCVLTNEGFMRQVLQYAREQGMLDWDTKTFSAPRYGRRLDVHRIRSSHLPLYAW